MTRVTETARLPQRAVLARAESSATAREVQARQCAGQKRAVLLVGLRALRTVPVSLSAPSDVGMCTRGYVTAN